ncbi:MAG: signal recognition particle-docking protein FtsY [Candidatus Aenigmarchaeota archaeon]|nr:signal recognition particle-docking protein FtsY [Candidatus Aenigmarchaeota archaeon]
MFGFLKKKLKEGIEKISKRVSKKEEERVEEAVEEIKREEKYIEESKKELVEEVEKEIEEVPEVEEKPEEIVEEKVEEVVEEKPEVIEEKIEEVKPEVVEELKPEVEVEVEKKPGVIERIKKKIKPVKEKPPEKKPKKRSILDKIKRRITEKKLTEDDVKDLLYELEVSLISSDVAVEVAEKICKDLKNNLVGKFIKRKEIEKIIKESFRKSILEILDVETFDLLEKIKTKKPFLIVFLGFNGSGKTTTIARIGHLLQKNNIKSVFAAGDSWRAAAIEQIEEHGKNLGINVIKHKYGADPAAVVFDAFKHAQSKDIDVVLADTAGRTHANVNLMEELKKIVRVNKPDLKILVLDALTGNDIYDQCKTFNDAVGVDALILTKVDVYEKGGAALSASHTINKPILYLGVGQGYEDLDKFSPNKIVEKLLE